MNSFYMKIKVNAEIPLPHKDQEKREHPNFPHPASPASGGGERRGQVDTYTDQVYVQKELDSCEVHWCWHIPWMQFFWQACFDFTPSGPPPAVPTPPNENHLGEAGGGLRNE